jgi:hypothetical protein
LYRLSDAIDQKSRIAGFYQEIIDRQTMESTLTELLNLLPPDQWKNALETIFETKIPDGEFDFEVVHYKTHNDIGEIDVIVKLEIEGGTVDMIMIGGGVETLVDAINNPDYGYEIEGEIADCIYEFLNNKIRNTTGYEIVIEKVILD